MPTESEPPVETVLSDEEESDPEDEVGTDLEETLHGEDDSQDTEVVAYPDDVGEHLFDATKCLVRLSGKSNGRHLLCGWSREECQRKRHHILRDDPEKRGQPGLYVATWNAGKTICDAIEPTYRDPEDQARTRARNRHLMVEVGASSRAKEQTEETFRERSPTVVTFGDRQEIGPGDKSVESPTPRRDQMLAWNAGLRGETGTPRGGTGFPPLTQVPTRQEVFPSSDPTLLRILDKMVNKFDEFQSILQNNQQELRDQLITPHALPEGPQATPPGRLSGVPNGGDRRDVPDEISTTSGRDHRVNRWYAVAKGRRTGVFTRWQDVMRSVKGYDGAMHKRFHNEDQAHLWLSERMEGNGQDPLGSDEWSLDGTQIEQPNNLSEERTERHPYENIIDPTKISGDKSVGQDREIFETSIEVEADVLKLLCPKGVTEEVRRELVEAAPDVVALPGKSPQNLSSMGESALVVDQLSEALGNLNMDRSRKYGTRTPRDTQWRMVSWNALKTIKSLQDLNDATDELGSLSRNVLGNMDMAFKDILATAGWSLEDSELYCTSGILPRIVRDTFVYYYHQLHIHLQNVALKHQDRWDEITSLHLEHHSKNLARIRQFALTKTQYVVQVYVYLREAKAKKFRDITLLTTITEDLEARLETGYDSARTP